MSRRRDPTLCNQCNKKLPRGYRWKNHLHCRRRMALHSKDRDAYLASRDPRMILNRAPRQLRVAWTERSGNRKLGPIPSAMSSPSTCPPTCGMFGKGCYAEFGFLSSHWSKVPTKGLPWADFCWRVADLPRGQLWRYATAGDLPGTAGGLNRQLLERLVQVNELAGARGFTFTHKPVYKHTTQAAIRDANRRGFTINLSADSLQQADDLASLGIAPVAVVVGRYHPQRSTTPQGRPVVVCPAETHGLTCKRCGMCAVPTRKAIVAFRAHGQFAAQVEQTVELRARKPTEGSV